MKKGKPKMDEVFVCKECGSTDIAYYHKHGNAFFCKPCTIEYLEKQKNSEHGLKCAGCLSDLSEDIDRVRNDSYLG